MNRLRALLVIIQAGYLNKVRTYRFLIVLGLTIIAGYVFVPAPTANYVTLGWGSSTTFYRGTYDSAWIGAMVALLTSSFLSLTGFYVVNDSVRRDEETRVGQIIATTPLSNSVYTLGNTLSNFMVLSTMNAIIFLTSIGMQLVRGEDLTINLWAMIAPFVGLVLPLMFLVSAVAVMFETRPRLKGGAGNVAYVFIWMFSLPILSESIDLFGIKAILSSMSAAGLASYPELAHNSFILGYGWGFPIGRALATFTWQGIQWTSQLLQTRLLLVGAATGISLLSSVGFSRFDPAREGRKAHEVPLDVLDVKEADIPPVLQSMQVQLRPLHDKESHFLFGSMLLAECRLILGESRDLPFLGMYGSSVAGALIIMGLLLPLEQARGMMLPLAWLLPVLIWSKLGTREVRYRTDQLVFSSAKALQRQLPAVWMAGVLLALVTGGGVAVNMALKGEWPWVIAWGVGALFIPSLALCLGVWTGSSKSFEFIYSLLWYIGPINQVEALDFMGAVPGSVKAGIWQYYLFISLALLILAFIGRRWQIQRG